MAACCARTATRHSVTTSWLSNGPSGGWWTRAWSRSSLPTATAGSGLRASIRRTVYLERYGEASVEVLFDGSAMPWICYERRPCPTPKASSRRRSRSSTTAATSGTGTPTLPARSTGSTAHEQTHCADLVPPRELAQTPPVDRSRLEGQAGLPGAQAKESSQASVAGLLNSVRGAVGGTLLGRRPATLRRRQGATVRQFAEPASSPGRFGTVRGLRSNPESSI